ncbi:MAG: aspartate-alanine antiporter [Bacteroidales bacterium]|nr:aspartate-alanine antiporter [Bacteroidales bacterium]MCF8387836.1 aspartate-alanine antiporter [Bacteroidales bacterium]MCF8397116.1 aspartate-alanine antiporter [Bacteroidales bacterium]
MDWLIKTLQENPGLAIFMTIALGFFIGKFKYKTFSLGSVTSVLLVGVIVGQLKIDISDDLKQIFFLIFLFSVGYSVGPQFFNSLKKSGLPQLLFTFLIAVFGLLVTWWLGKMMGYNAGQAAGLLAGAQTISAVIGVGQDTIGSLDISAAEKESMQSSVAVCYAVTYLFGTIGTAFLLAQVGPLFWGGLKKARQQCIDLEKKMGLPGKDQYTMISPYSNIVFRAYNLKPGAFAIGKTSAEIDKHFFDLGHRIYVYKMRKKDSSKVEDVDPNYRFQEHDDIVLQGNGPYVISIMKDFGHEIYDPELLKFKVENIKILLTNKKVHGMTVHQLGQQRPDLKVSLVKITRGGMELPLTPQTVIHKGDMLYLIGSKEDVDDAVKLLGFPDVSTEKTDMISVGIGILIGGIIGLLTLQIGKMELSLSASGGALIAGLFLGWLRSKHPTFAQVPEPALWIMTNLGLNTFIAVVGITAAPSFVEGFKEVGASLFLIGALASAIPVILGLFMARYIFKFNAPLGLGCCCGARVTTAGLPAVEDALQSNLPALGYTVTYAVGNTLLIICGIIVVFLFS